MTLEEQIGKKIIFNDRGQDIEGFKTYDGSNGPEICINGVITVNPSLHDYHHLFIEVDNGYIMLNPKGARRVRDILSDYIRFCKEHDIPFPEDQ